MRGRVDVMMKTDCKIKKKSTYSPLNPQLIGNFPQQDKICDIVCNYGNLMSSG